MKLQAKLLTPTAKLPTKAHALDAGYDVYADEDVMLFPNQQRIISTGVSLAIPKGSAIFVLPRSGHAARSGISITNSPGLIDSGYTGELKVILRNDGHAPFEITKDTRIAQLVHFCHISGEIELTKEDVEAKDTRGQTGFGASGK